MEIMEDGNLVDRVRILLQRDMQYYQVSPQGRSLYDIPSIHIKTLYRVHGKHMSGGSRDTIIAYYTRIY